MEALPYYTSSDPHYFPSIFPRKKGKIPDEILESYKKGAKGKITNSSFYFWLLRNPIYISSQQRLLLVRAVLS